MTTDNLTTTDLTSFGNLLLSEQRKQYIGKDHQDQDGMPIMRIGNT